MTCDRCPAPAVVAVGDPPVALCMVHVEEWMERVGALMRHIRQLLEQQRRASLS